MNEIETIKQMYIKYWEFMIHKDKEGLNSLFSPNYTLTHMTGAKQSAEEFIQGLMNGTFNYYSAKHELIDVHIQDDTPFLIGQSKVVASVYGGKKHTWHLQGSFTLTKENNAYKFLSSHASTY